MLATSQPVSKPNPLPLPPLTELKEGRVYAIAFDMDIDSLRQAYGDQYNNRCPGAEHAHSPHVDARCTGELDALCVCRCVSR